MPGEYLRDYTAVVIATIAGIAMVLGAFTASYILSPRVRSALKAIPYECGMQPVGRNWSQMHFRYYAFGILFLVFDVEAVFLFPWAVVFLGPLVTAAIFASAVCGITPSSAATTRIAMSVTWAPRARMAVNASWPGVSMNVMRWPSCST